MPILKQEIYITQHIGQVWRSIRPTGLGSFITKTIRLCVRKDQTTQESRCTDVTFDDQSNLWVTTVLAPEHRLAVLKSDGEWVGFDPPSFGEYPSEVVIDRNGLKWVIMGDNAQAVYVFDEGEDMNSSSDDRFYVFSSSNSELPSNKALSIAVDREGDVWVGTDQGAVVFECSPDDIFNGECVGNRRKVEQDSILALLLETEEVLTIAVDGANRKWFGTRNGIYVQSSSGEDQEFAFNTSNSPLPSNTILDIDIDGETGTAYIANRQWTNGVSFGRNGRRPFSRTRSCRIPQPCKTGGMMAQSQ